MTPRNFVARILRAYAVWLASIICGAGGAPRA